MKTGTLISLQIPWEGKRRGICQLQGITPSVVQALWTYRGSVCQDRSWQTALCFLLTLAQESPSELHPVFVLHQHSAPVVSPRGISAFTGRSPHTLREECTRKNPLTRDVQVNPYKSFRKIRITVLWRQRHVHSLCQKSKLFFFKSQAHCSCYFGSRESIPYSRET